jgi:hypothetical protein
MVYFDRFTTWLSDLLIRILIKEHRGYVRRFPHDLAQLRATLQPGDVILVEGSQRISEVIKYLTQSSWSHAALFVGDALVRRGPHQASEWRTRYGDAADALLVEANVEDGVTAVPLSKYINHNLRICRPVNLRPGDLATVLETVISQIGYRYNRAHIRSLLLYFLPVELLPKRWRRRAFDRARDLSKEVICSTQIAMAFQKVRYPIQPEISQLDGQPVAKRRLPGWLLVGRRNQASVFERGVFTPCDPALLTPRDFDLSPYFEIVKPVTEGRRDFDYKKIRWSAPATGANNAHAEPAIERPTTQLVKNGVAS